MENKALAITAGIVLFVVIIFGAFYLGKKSQSKDPSIENITLSEDLKNRNPRPQESVVEKVKSPEELKDELEQKEREEPLKYLTIEDFTSTPILIGNKVTMSAKVKNHASIATFKDVALQFDYYSKTNTLIGSNEKTIYEFFPPNKEVSINWLITNPKGVTNAQINRISCSVTDAVAVVQVEF